MSNKLNIDLTGKVVLLNSKVYPGPEKERRFLCQGGFGCSTITSGTVIFGLFLIDGMKAKISAVDIEKVSEDQSIPEKYLVK